MTIIRTLVFAVISVFVTQTFITPPPRRRKRRR